MENNDMVKLIVNLSNRHVNHYYSVYGAYCFYHSDGSNNWGDGADHVIIENCQKDLIWYELSEKDQVVFLGIHLNVLLRCNNVTDNWKKQ
jgi:hypothetical protein